MIQGGKPKNCKKRSKKGFCIFKGKNYFEDEIIETLKFDKRGVLAMANKGPNTNSSQFFITYKEQPHLNNTATIFGKLIHGEKTLTKMENARCDLKHKPRTPIKILSTIIHANPIAMKDLD